MISTQEVIQAQDESISELLKVVKEQNEHLTDQKNKIKSLENKVVVFFFVHLCYVHLLHQYNPRHLIRHCHFISSETLPDFRKLCLSLVGMLKATACRNICPTIPMTEAFQVVRHGLQRHGLSSVLVILWTECVNDCCVDFPGDCGEVFSSGEKTNGLYPIKPNGSEPFLVYCEFTEGKNTHTHYFLLLV